MSNNALNPFDFNSQQIRAIADDQGEPWFVARDICQILGYKNESLTIKRHCRQGGVSKRYLTDSLGREQEAIFINEGNLYRLIVKSSMPEAERFESWVCDEVLPAIRKTGAYASPGRRSKTPRFSLDEILSDTTEVTRSKIGGWLCDVRKKFDDAGIEPPENPDINVDALACYALTERLIHTKMMISFYRNGKLRVQPIDRPEPIINVDLIANINDHATTDEMIKLIEICTKKLRGTTSLK